jgi:hypothetical protein
MIADTCCRKLVHLVEYPKATGAWPPVYAYSGKLTNECNIFTVSTRCLLLLEYIHNRPIGSCLFRE